MKNASFWIRKTYLLECCTISATIYVIEGYTLLFTICYEEHNS